MRTLVSPIDYKINVDTDYLAFIEEAGDEGFHARSPRWLVVSGIVMKFSEYKKATSLIDNQTSLLKKKPENFSFKNLTHNQRKDWCYDLNEVEYTTMHSAFAKFHLSKEEKDLITYPSMYFWGVKNILERRTWFTQQSKREKVHVMIAKRNNISADAMQAYLYGASIQAQKNLWYANRLGKVVLGSVQDKGIRIADTIASSMFQALEPIGKHGMIEEDYFNLCLKDHLYKSDHPKFGGIWCNGFKCTPTDASLIKNGILTEGSSST